MVVGWRYLAICSKVLSVNTQTSKEPLGPAHKVLSGPLSSFPIESIEKSKSTIIDSGSQYMSNPVLFLSEARVRMLLGLHRLRHSVGQPQDIDFSPEVKKPCAGSQR